jgi:RNA polymerase sigma-70 factor (ECF subfamily)
VSGVITFPFPLPSEARVPLTVKADGGSEHARVDPLVQAVLRGGADAFAPLYDAHAARVRALCLGLVGDETIADELVQDVFVRVWERLASFRGESTFSTWLHRLTINVVFQQDRSRRRRAARVAIVSDFASPTALGDGVMLDAIGHTARSHDPTERMDLDAAIRTLPPGARAVFTMHDVGGLSHQEIATELGIAEGTSKAHLFRARRLLRVRLRAYGSGDSAP